MQNRIYGYDRTKLVILSCVTIMFVIIFSSTTMAAIPVTAQNNTNNAKFDQTKPLNDKGTALVGSGKYNESITYFDKALAINPNDVGALTGKGLALLLAGKYNDSITHFDKALSINPNDVMALTSKGLALGRLGKYTDSITYYDKALAINPNFPVAVKEKEFFVALAAHKAASTNATSAKANSTNATSTATKKP
jgi:tetratricopeptide (TPR) repeat protein